MYYLAKKINYKITCSDTIIAIVAFSKIAKLSKEETIRTLEISKTKGYDLNLIIIRFLNTINCSYRWIEGKHINWLRIFES